MMTQQEEDKMRLEMRQIYADLAEYEAEVVEHNSKLIESFGKTAKSDFIDLLDFVDVTEKIEFVNKPKGSRQNESHGIFKNVYVEQWSTSMDGDSYSGFIYTFVNNKWIKIPYSC